MTADQFCAWLLFASPMLMFIGKPFNTTTLFGFMVFSVIPITLFFIAENEFIKDCKRGYCEFEDSIFPQLLYKRWESDME